MTIIADILFILLWLLGLALTIVPVVPATLIIWGAGMLHGLLTGFWPLEGNVLLIFSLLGIAALAVDNLAGAWGAKRFGGSSAAIWGALIGSVVGLFFGLFGLLLGPVIGAVVAEFVVGRQLPEALRSGLGTLVGMLGGVVAKLIIHVVMGVFVLSHIF